MSENCVVVDLGTTKVACLAAELDSSGRARHLGHSQVPSDALRRGTVGEVEGITTSVRAAISRLQEETGIEAGPIVVSLGVRQADAVCSQGIVPVYPRTRAIGRDDVLQVVSHSRNLEPPQDRELVQAIPFEFRVDGEPCRGRPIGLSGGRLEVSTLLVFADRLQLDGLEKSVTSLGRSVDQFVLEPLASGLGVLSAHQMEVGAAVVDIGGGTTSIGVFGHGSMMHAGGVPLGSAHVTSDLAQLLKCSTDEAEDLKVRYGAATTSHAGPEDVIMVLQLGQVERRPMHRSVFCEIVESRMREIARMAKEEIERAGALESLRGGVVVTGGGSLLPGCDALFESVLSPAKVKLGKPSMGGPHGTEIAKPEFAAAVGMARFALECCRDELSPADSDGKWRDKIRTFLSLLGGRA